MADEAAYGTRSWEPVARCDLLLRGGHVLDVTGAFADIVMLDPKRVIDRASFDHPKEPSEGICLVMVNGQIVWRDGRSGDARPGRVLRRSAQAAGSVG